MTGAVFRNSASQMVNTFNTIDPATHPLVYQLLHTVPFPDLQLATAATYIMVGAASVLAALFRAPLTATLLSFNPNTAITTKQRMCKPLMHRPGSESLITISLSREHNNDTCFLPAQRWTTGRLTDQNNHPDEQKELQRHHNRNVMDH
jgi:hypothetical protein